MNSLLSKVINDAVAGYQEGDTAILFSVPPGSPKTVASPGPVAPRPSRSGKPQLEVELDWNTDSTLYSDFGDEPVGVFVATHKRIAVGTVVDLEIAMPDGQTVKTTGRVQWTQEPRDPSDETVPGIGIAFTHVAERPSWNPSVPEVVTPSMPPVRVVSIHPLGQEESNALTAFGQVRPPTFYIE